MKYLLLFAVFSLLKGKFDCQTTNAGVEETTFEGSAVTDEPTPTCPEDYCEYGVCSIVDSARYCTCLEGYYGDLCQYKEGGCVEEFAIVIETGCNKNATNVTVSYTETVVGAWAATNATCVTCDGKTSPLGRRKCVQEGNSYILKNETFANCDVTLADQPIEEQTDFYVTATSNSSMSPDTINEAVNIMENVTAENEVSPSAADDMATLANNLLLADDDASVADNSASILSSIDEMTAKVELSTSDGIDSYRTEESNIAIAVVSDGGPVGTRSFEGDYYYGPEADWDSNMNLAQSNMTLSQDSNKFSGSYMKATAGDDRISFKIYSQADNLFTTPEREFAQKIVFSVDGTNEFTLNFQTSETLDAFNGDELNRTQEGNEIKIRRIACMKWNNGDWLRNDGCQPNGGGNKLAACSCTQPGSYTLVTREAVEYKEIGLTGGEIAGIVVGSVVGVALIAGAIYYFAVYRKSKKATKVKPTDEDIPMQEGRDSDNESRAGGHSNDAASVQDD